MTLGKVSTDIFFPIIGVDLNNLFCKLEQTQSQRTDDEYNDVFTLCRSSLERCPLSVSSKAAIGQQNSYMSSVRASVLRHNLTHKLRTCDINAPLSYVLNNSPSQDALIRASRHVHKQATFWNIVDYNT